MTNSITAFGSLLNASLDDRTLTYRLLPYGEVGRTNVGKVTASKGKVTIPEDPTTLVANLEHDGTRPIAKFTSLTESDEGLDCTVRVLGTSAGDDLLIEADEGVRTGISVEIENPVIRGGNLLGGALTGAGFVTKPAFPSAQLVAADAGDLPPDFPEWDLPGSTTSTNTSTDEITIDGVVYTITRKTETTSTTEVNTNDEAAPPAAESETTVTDVTAAAVAAPTGLQAAHANKADAITAKDAYAALAAGFRSQSPAKLTAALSNIVHDDGDNDGDGLGERAAAPAWLGEVYRKAPYQRRFVSLVANDSLTSYKVTGFKYASTPTVATYSGNKAEITSGALTATDYEAIAKRWAVGNDIDRRFVDFGDTTVVQAWFEFAANSYKKVTDLDLLAYLIAQATEVTPGTVPTGVSAVSAAIVDGALDLIANDLTPTFAVVGSDIYRDYALTPRDKRTEFLSESVGLTEAQVAGFRVLPSALPAMASQVIVADGSTVRFRELGSGTPIRVEAEHVSNGGQDVGIFGYSLNEILDDNGVVFLDLSAGE